MKMLKKISSKDLKVNLVPQVVVVTYQTLAELLKCVKLHPSGALSGIKQMLRPTPI